MEINSRRAFSESNIGGWDYLRNMVQLPFYLQNSALRRVKTAQAIATKRMQVINSEDFSTSLQRSVSAIEHHNIILKCMHLASLFRNNMFFYSTGLLQTDTAPRCLNVAVWKSSNNIVFDMKLSSRCANKLRLQFEPYRYPHAAYPQHQK